MRTSRYHATFPSGHSTPLLVKLLFPLATYSRWLRNFFFSLPTSRIRIWLVANYYWLLLRQFRDGDLSFLRAIDEQAELTFFAFGTYRGRNGWREALNAWRESFSGGPTFELTEFFEAGSERGVLLSMRMGGTGGSSQVVIEEMAYFQIVVEGGDAVRGRLFRDKQEALEAVGLQIA